MFSLLVRTYNLSNLILLFLLFRFAVMDSGGRVYTSSQEEVVAHVILKNICFVSACNS